MVRTITATTPDGTPWRVRVIWQPRWRALARRFGGWRRKRRRRDNSGGLDGMDVPTSGGGGSDDWAVAILVIVGLIVVGGAFWWLLLPLLLVLIDAIVIMVLLAGGIATRVLLRRPWTVEATNSAVESDDPRFTTDVVGWREALRVRDEIAANIERGHPQPVPDPRG